ncbi:YIP1 family protein [Primorskyibacter sp. S87]|uniref:YIP1 family protein n=1 Tax=Primorskyibacter sp. S87 TaxID=3415126 RepID=UPI003C7E4F61
MPVTADIAATYRGPGKVMRRLLSMGQREDRALAFVMAFCVVAFIAQMPLLARKAHLEGVELNMLLGGALLGTVIILPLLLYILSFVSFVVARLFGSKPTAYAARLALFWSLLASTPLMLLHGLVAGMIGPGTAMSIVGALWAAVFLWFWLSNLIEAGKVIEVGKEPA